MLEQILLGAVIVAATLVTACRAVRLRRLLGYAAVFDLVFAFTLFEAFGGSFSGLIVSAMAGLMMALVLTALRWIIGYDYITLERTKRGDIRRVRRDIPARFNLIRKAT